MLELLIDLQFRVYYGGGRRLSIFWMGGYYTETFETEQEARQQMLDYANWH